MTKEIIVYPNSLLRKKSKEVKEMTPGIKKLALSMTETMLKGQGIGLAAPQIGELKRIIIVQTEKGPGVFINPKITKKSRKKETAQEGCLSFPGLFLEIKRAKKIEIEALNLKGEKKKIKVEGLTARIFQHEIDHLNGVLFIDRLSFWKRLFRAINFKPLSGNKNNQY